MTSDELELSLRDLSGKVTAIEVAVKTLIVAHPDRKRLARIWHAMLPGQIDHFMEHPAYAVEHQRNAINAMLASIGEFVEMKIPGEPVEDEGA